MTGSGKTEIYLKLIAELLAKETNAQILILLPEILLISEIKQRIIKYFNLLPEIWHSDIPVAVKKNIMQKVILNQNKIILGTRSALFLPFTNLRLIIVDEEHSSSYKQESNFIYHARDMAVIYAKFCSIPIILLSATPSLETIFNVKYKEYKYFKLESRFGNSVLPDIRLIDLNQSSNTKSKKY